MRNVNYHGDRSWITAKVTALARRHLRLLVVMAAAALCPLAHIFAHSEHEKRESFFHLDLEELAGVPIVTASRVPEPAGATTSTVYVVTADEIREMNARTIYDVLDTVPGIEITFNRRNWAIIAVRGIRNFHSNGVLVLLNGFRMHDTVWGSATFVDLARVPVHNIRRIEVVHGPGSNVYGANAFLSTINIVTDEPGRPDGVEMTVSHEFEDEGEIGQDYNISFGSRLNDDVALSVNVNAVDGDGPSLFVERDRAGRSGFADAALDQADIQLRGEAGKFQLNARYSDQERGGFFGPTSILSPQSSQDRNFGFVELKYGTSLTPHVDILAGGFINHMANENYLVPNPAGTLPGSPFNETGRIFVTELKNTRYGGDIQGTYRGWNNHEVVAGISWEDQTQHDVKVKSNDDGSGVPVPLQDRSATMNFNRSVSREVLGIYVLDLWNPRDDFNLSTGARLDRYADFGTIVNPRFGLNWRFIEAVALRALYGEAYRAPNFGSLYQMNANIAGNPGLDPERIKTFEIGFSSVAVKRFAPRITFYHNRLRDLIVANRESRRFENLDAMESRGFEVQGRWSLAGGARLTVSYSYTDVSGNDSGDSVSIPRNSVDASIYVPVFDTVSVNINWEWQDETSRGPTDSRSDLAKYGVADLSLNMRDAIWTGLDLSASVYNVFDESYTYPALVNEIPGDFTAPGRSFLLTARYRF